MNRKQLIVIWAGILIVVAMCLFPPWRYYHRESSTYLTGPYRLIFLGPPDVPTKRIYPSKVHPNWPGHNHQYPNRLLKDYSGDDWRAEIDTLRIVIMGFILAVIFGGLMVSYLKRQPPSNNSTKTENNKRVNQLMWTALATIIIFFILVPLIFTPGTKGTLFLQAIGVLISAAIALFAIMGEQIRARYFGPRLHLSIYKAQGEETYSGTKSNRTYCRYFHFKVENLRKGLTANKVQVVLRSIDSPYNGGGNRRVTVGGRLPFKWSYRVYFPNNFDYVYYSNIGCDDLCDVAVLTKGENLKLLPDEWHSIKDQLNIFKDQKAEIEAVAVSENSESNHIKVEISWDGIWPDDDDDALNHVRFREL
jgi:hypothetical protein